MKLEQRYTAEIEVDGMSGVSFAVREGGKLVVRAESQKSVDDAIGRVRDVGARIDAACTQTPVLETAGEATR